MATHNTMLKLAACGVAKTTDNLDWLAECLNALLPPGYTGNTKTETLGMLEDAREKDFGATPPSKHGRSQETLASSVLRLVQEHGIILFHDPQGRGFLSIPQDVGGALNYPIRSVAGEDCVRRLYYLHRGGALAQNTLATVISTLDANARFEGKQEQTYLRYAHTENNVIIDLGRSGGEVVRIRPGGWEVTTDCPVRFYRPAGFVELPIPEIGENLERLKVLLGLDERNWLLIIAFLVNCLKGDGPFMILLIEGEQGSGKSVLCDLLKLIIDPNIATKLRLPSNERDLSIHAKEHFLLIYDNVSGFKGDISDALCALATGSGYAVRRLYTDDELQVFAYCRPFVLNGNTEIAHRPDLLERAIPLKLPSMSPDQRLSERELRSRFDSILAETLGVLYDAVACALKNLENTSTPSGIRMADAAQWILASEPALDGFKGDLLAALSDAQNEIMVDRIKNDPVYIALHRALVLDKTPIENTLGDLHGMLLTQLDAHEAKFFPQTSSHLSRHLNRTGPALAKAGIRVTEGPRRREGKIVLIDLISTDGDGSDASDGHSTPRTKRGGKPPR